MIKFGTDGWRALIAEDFTFQNLRMVALATARYIQKNKRGKYPSAVIGYDTRFLSKEFAMETARILAWQGITVHISDVISSTPQVSYHTKQKAADLGVVITASHNPPLYNGYKIKASFGGPATPEQIAEIEAILKKIMVRPPQFKYKEYNDYINYKNIREFDAQESYIRYIRKKIDMELINDSKLKILYDPMYGSGIHTLDKLVPSVKQIHNEHNPSFGDVDHPEPIGECLGELMQKVKLGKYDIGIATDGDADRLGLVDSDGAFVDSHRIFMILLKYLHEVKKKKGAVAKTVSLTSMVNIFCERNNIPLYETGVGFKYIAKIMSQEKILIGGEESGGMSTALHIPERDGIFNALLICEIMAARKKSLKQLCEELDLEFGHHRFLRRDVKVTEQAKKQILDACNRMPKELGKHKVIKSQTTDGFKFFIEGGWLLIRASGTEPLIRFYSEAENYSIVNELLDEGMKLK